MNAPAALIGAASHPFHRAVHCALTERRLVSAWRTVRAYLHDDLVGKVEGVLEGEAIAYEDTTTPLYALGLKAIIQSMERSNFAGAYEAETVHAFDHPFAPFVAWLLCCGELCVERVVSPADVLQSVEEELKDASNLVDVVLIDETKPTDEATATKSALKIKIAGLR